MKIALLEYGKMGKAIEAIAIERGHEIVLKVSIENVEDNTIENIRRADVAIEFTSPESAYDNLLKCSVPGVPVVCGSTGWLKQYDEICKWFKKKKGALLYASNFSVGVNLFFELNRKLIRLMKNHSEYEVSVHEIHHTEKKMHPAAQPSPLLNRS